MKRAVLIISSLLLILAAVVSAGWISYYYFLMPNNDVVPAFDEDKLYLIIEGEILRDEPKVVDDEIMLPIETIRKYFDTDIHWDDKLQKVTITTKGRVIRMKTDSLNAFVNNKPVKLSMPVTAEDGIVYIPIGFLSDFYGIDINYLRSDNIIMIDYRNSVQQIAEPIHKDAVIRKGRSVRYPVMKKFDLQKDEPENLRMRIFEEYDKWYKVRTSDGVIGFIEKRYVVVKRVIVTRLPEEDIPDKAWEPEQGKINLVWEMMYKKMPDLNGIGKIKGLDVLSPTWFQVANDKGDLINRARARYVEWAHQNGYKVWALLSNDFQDPSMTGRFLNNTDARDNLIRQLLLFASLYKLDGINIDFENINLEDKDALTQFVRELTPLLKEQGLVVSIDIGVPGGSENYSLCYDREALGKIVDYVMVMTYDQHWGSSPKAGSVAQLAWVEKNIIKTLESVPREKLLLGIPFYTRLWKEEAGAGGKLKVSNPDAPSMEEAKEIIRDNGASVGWDAGSGQFYTEFKKDDATYKIWLEDADSINLKSALVHKYKLAGAAAWKRGDETPEIWEVLNKNLKEMDSYSQWTRENQGKTYIYKKDGKQEKK